MEKVIGAKIEPKPSRRLLRLSVRALMVAVLLLALTLGWMVQRVKVQREAIAAIRQVGGAVAYDFQRPPGKPNNPNAEPNAPKWLVQRIGVDYFADVVAVMVGKFANDDTLAHVGRLPKVKSVYGPGAIEITDAGAAQLAGLTHLESVNLSGTSVTGAALANFRGMASLKNISFIGPPVAVSDADLAHLEGLTGLESLFVSHTQVSDAGLAHLEGLVNMQQLWLTSTEITGPGLVHLKGMTGLQGLHLNNGKLRDISFLPPLPALKQLLLNETAIDDAQLATVAKLPSLNDLDLRVTGITDAGLARLEGLRGTLRALHLSRTKVTDAAVTSLQKFGKLERLSLDDTKITDATLDQLAGLNSLRNLSVINTAVTDAGVARLKLALPFLTVMQAAPNNARARPRAAANRPAPSPGPQP